MLFLGPQFRNLNFIVYIQALVSGCFTRFENGENWSSQGCFTSTRENRVAGKNPKRQGNTNQVCSVK